MIATWKKMLKSAIETAFLFKLKRNRMHRSRQYFRLLDSSTYARCSR